MLACGWFGIWVWLALGLRVNFVFCLMRVVFGILFLLVVGYCLYLGFCLFWFGVCLDLFVLFVVCFGVLFVFGFVGLYVSCCVGVCLLCLDYWLVLGF